MPIAVPSAVVLLTQSAHQPEAFFDEFDRIVEEPGSNELKFRKVLSLSLSAKGTTAPRMIYPAMPAWGQFIQLFISPNVPGSGIPVRNPSTGHEFNRSFLDSWTTSGKYALFEAYLVSHGYWDRASGPCKSSLSPWEQTEILNWAVDLYRKGESDAHSGD